jgi:predicted metal-binding protein
MPSFIHKVEPVLDQSVRALCVRAYDGHPKGCPNFRKRKTCPPYSPLFEEVFDLSYPVYAIGERFNLKAHEDKMRSRHPDWSYKQLTCCLYWQGSVRKQLKEEIKKFQKSRSCLICTDCPEALGVNVTATLDPVGIKLEWPPINYVVKVALCGTPKG